VQPVHSREVQRDERDDDGNDRRGGFEIVGGEGHVDSKA